VQYPEPTVDPYPQPDTPGDDVEFLARHMPVRESRVGPLWVGVVVLVVLVVLLVGPLALISAVFRPG
jgi:hypothetical protein